MPNQPSKNVSERSLFDQLTNKLNLDTYTFSYYQSLLSKGMASYLANHSQKALPPDEYQAIYTAHENMVDLLNKLEHIYVADQIN